MSLDHISGAGSASIPDEPCRNGADQLLLRIRAEYDTLSPRLKSIAHFVDTHADQVGILDIRSIADQCGVHPSAVVRFAQHFGLSGYADLRRRLRQQIAPPLPLLRDTKPAHAAAAAAGLDGLTESVLASSLAAVARLSELLASDDWRRALAMLRDATTIWVMGVRQAFPVAVHLTQTLRQTGKTVCLFATLGGTDICQVGSVRPGDVFVAVELPTYGDETARVARLAKRNGVQLILLTDSCVSPLARDADALLRVEDGAVFGVHSIAAASTVAQLLFALLCYGERRGGRTSLCPTGQDEVR
ncbi:MurR/RpiR family transcriptional regulator [Burkholderia sp. ABCPW 11]|uniref:MurR/RpiR family transcriptional regulator n=1 Tax=Burkholderia sp. ABCPW 11 TaxID=1637859 RepID=UPI000A71C1D0|nr:MurR/RpiR family transcriptional regulator [Burkholderia sp. ABCPW 11]